MRKPALAITAVCVIASLLFFFAPVFRQAFRVSLLQWQFIFKTDSRPLSPQLQSLVSTAEQNHDAEALAFVAFRRPQPSEAARIADEAVRLDPSLTWVYAIVAVDYSFLPQIDRWVPALEGYDPQNTLPYLIAAERIDIDRLLTGNVAHRAEDQPPAWQSSMATAFGAAKLDSYSSQRRELDRRVFNRYHIGDPELIADDAWFYSRPSCAASDAYNNADMSLASAQVLEAQSRPKPPPKNIWPLFALQSCWTRTPVCGLASARNKPIYQPYGEIMRRYMRDGDEASLTNLLDFLRHADAPMGSGWLHHRQDYSYYFWLVVIVLCALAGRGSSLLPHPCASQRYDIASINPCASRMLRESSVPST